MNTNTYKFILEPYKLGGSTKYTCPSCGRKKCFTKYVRTETGEYVDDSCGKCDHDNSCGYHYRPRDFFRDHPDYSYTPSDSASYHPVEARQNVPQTEFIPMDIVERCHSTESVFWNWLCTITSDKERLQTLFDLYHIGAMKTGEVIFWQIDKDGKVHDGKIMTYEADGHRSQTVKPNFMGTKFRLVLGLSEDFRNQRQQCFFGEHLLSQYPDLGVRLVESEKTAVVMALFFPGRIWLATGGSSLLSPEKVECLKGREVCVYPDSGCLDKWKAIMAKTDGIRYKFSKRLEQYPSNTDIADILLSKITNNM